MKTQASTIEIALSSILTASVVAMALVVVAREIRLARRPLPRIPARDTLIVNWQEHARSGIRIGPENAAVTIMEFMDFECPFCAAFEETTLALRVQYPTDVAIVFHHFPLNNHRFARVAALAGECAHVQGRFAEMKERLFAAQDSFGLKPWNEYASAAGIERIDTFNACLEAGDQARIDEGLAVGTHLGVHGTPTVVVNGWKLARPPRLPELREMVERAKRGSSPVNR